MLGQQHEKAQHHLSLTARRGRKVSSSKELLHTPTFILYLLYFVEINQSAKFTVLFCSPADRLPAPRFPASALSRHGLQSLLAAKGTQIPLDPPSPAQNKIPAAKCREPPALAPRGLQEHSHSRAGIFRTPTVAFPRQPRGRIRPSMLHPAQETAAKLSATEELCVRSELPLRAGGRTQPKALPPEPAGWPGPGQPERCQPCQRTELWKGARGKATQGRPSCFSSSFPLPPLDISQRQKELWRH